MGITAGIHIETWNRDIPDVNRTVKELRLSKFSKPVGFYTLSRYGFHSYGEGNHSAQAPQHKFARS